MHYQEEQPSSQQRSKVQMWAQNTYMVDSGVNSAAHSAQPSLMSGMTALHEELHSAYDNPQFGYPFSQEQVDEMNEQYAATRTQRIRSAMFPETLEESDMHSAPTAYDLGQSTNVQRLTEPSQMLKTAVVEVINYQDDAELATRAIPELIKLLSDKDEVVVGHAAQMVHMLSKRQASGQAVMRNAELIEALLHAARNTRNGETTRDAAAALYHISQHGEGLMHIFRTGGIPELVRMLGSPVEAVVNYAITTLHNLILHQENAKAETRACGGIEKMVPLLDRPNEKFLAIVTDCTYALILQHPESKLVFLSCGGPPRLVNIVRSYNYEKLLYTATRNLKALSICPQNKSAIVGAGGMQALQLHLNSPSPRLIRNILWTLRNLSDAATKEDNVIDLLVHLTRLLASTDDQVVICCAGILSNLSCNNARNKQTLCANGGTVALIRALGAYMEVEDVTEPALCALRHMTTRHAMAEQAQTDVRVYNGIPVVLQLLSKMRAPIAKASLGLVRNLAQLESNLVPLRDERVVSASGPQTVVTLAVDVLTRAFTQIKETQMQGGSNVPITDGVTMNELIECSVSALHHLAKEPVCCRQITECHNITQVLVQLLASEVENIAREAVGLLYEISKTAEGAKAVDAEGPTPILTDLLRSHNQAISTYASGVLKNLQMDKPAEYRRQLDMEIHSALYRDDSAAWAQDGLGEMQSMPGDEPFNDIYQSPAYDPVGLGDDHWGPGERRTNAPIYAPAGGQQQGGGGWYDTDL